MEWLTIRSAFMKMRGARTQERIAKAAGIPQNYISRVESNTGLGPSVEVFIKAVQGLGLTPAQFFQHLDAGTEPALSGASDDREVSKATGRAVGANDLRHIGDAFLAAAAAIERAGVTESVRSTRPRKTTARKSRAEDR